MGNNRNAVSPGRMEWADVNSGSTVYVRDTNQYFNTPDTYVDKYGVTRDRWKSIPASALRSLVDLYTGGSTRNNRDAKGKFDADKQYMAVDDLFKQYMELEGIGIKTATLLCIAIKNESGSWRWAVFTICYTTTLAWLSSMLVYQVGSLFM